MPQPARIIVPIDSQQVDSWNYALAYAEKICTSETPPIRDVILLIHTKHQLKHTSLAGFVGAPGVKQLNAGKTLNFSAGATLRLATKQTISALPAKTVVIVFYADDALLEVVDGLRNVAGVVAVPDHPQDADQWAARWNPVVHGQAAKAPVPLLTDTVVENALKDVTGWINRANGALIARDQEHAEDALRILRAKGHTAEPQHIKSWAIQNGWTTGAASDLAKLAAKILGMKTKPKLTAIHNAEGRYERWTK